MKIKLLTSIASATGSYNRGDEYECASAEEAARFVDAGMGEMLPTKETATAKEPKASKKAVK